MNILITGSAGFIGFSLAKALLARGEKVVGIDNLNDYYDSQLKRDRLQHLVEFVQNKGIEALYKFINIDIVDRHCMSNLFQQYDFDIVVNLGAQAGIRHSIDNPSEYIESNIVGFANVLEGCRHSQIKHLIYASSSSVYGMNTKQPFSTTDRVDNPISLYAATKKSNELMAHSYSHLFDVPTTGLRFFTVYGPWGRPDMAYFKFTQSILEDRPIDVYNYGEMQRDFTYIDDIIEGVIRVINNPPLPNIEETSNTKARYKIYNLGNSQPISLRRFITALEDACGKKAVENPLPMQPGDSLITYADISESIKDFDFKPNTSIEVGLRRFIQWYKDYYK